MRSATDGFANVISGSHQMAARVDVLFNRAVVFEGLPITGGQISYDRTAARLARLTLDVADPLRLPLSSDDILTPYGYELLVWRGAVVSGEPELLPLGVFPIQTSVADGSTLLSSITADDRSKLVSDARFEDDYQIAAGTNYATAIQDMIEDGVSGLEYLFPSTTYTTPLLTFAAQEDRWDAAVKMAKSIGNEIRFDGLGRCVMQPEPVFASDPVATISEGANLTSIKVALDRGPAYNRVIASGRNASSGAVYRGVATDNNTSSPTYYLGPFGKKPRFFYSEFIASDAQATTAATAILASNIGVADAVQFSLVPDPRLECSDVVLVTDSALEIDRLYILETLTIGLTADSPMTGTSRSQQTTT